MNNDILYRRQIVEQYRPDVEKMLPYVAWLQTHEGSQVSRTYEDNGIGENSVAFPVYDGTLMNFIRTVQKTKLLDRNYTYVYSKYRIRSVEDERRVIDAADIRGMKTLQGILSRYVLGGMTKGRLWSEAVQNGVFLRLILKMKTLLEFWDRPMD